MEWLKSELQTRFKVPVKYVVLSHDHQSHICDTQVFADTAVGIGHEHLAAHHPGETAVHRAPGVVRRHDGTPVADFALFSSIWAPPTATT